MLSRTTQTVITIPSLGTEIPLGREQFNGLIAPVLRPTISMTRSLLLDANTASAPTTVVVLVGGASRVPLVATMLHEALNLPPVVIEQPELVVAEGALHATTLGPLPPRGATGASPTSPFAANPVSGGGGPAGPVSGGLIPVSGGFMAIGDTTGTSAPTSAATLYGRPPVDGRGVPTVRPTDSPADSGRRSAARRANAALIVAGMVTVLLVLGFGTAGAIWYAGRSDVTSNPTASTSASPGKNDSRAKYNAEAMFPKDFNMCQKVDLDRFAASFDKQLSSPLPQTLLANDISTASCTFARQRGGASLNLTITASVYADTNIATSQQRTARVNAKQADPAFRTLTDVGDEAILYRNQAPDPSAPGKQAYYTESIRDGNLVLTGMVLADKSNGGEWTPTERDQITEDLQVVAKSTLKKLTGA
jgi:hypothetical protein